MSVELHNASGELGQFASSGGYSDLIAAAQSNPTLRKFFDDASTEDVKPVEEALNGLEGDKDVMASARQLAALMHGQDLVFVSNGTHDDKLSKWGDDDYGPEDREDEDDRSEEDDTYDSEKADTFEFSGSITKVDSAQHLVFGWASIVSINGKPVTDTQGDVITAETIESAAYEFCLNARMGGEMHEAGNDGKVKGIGRLVESCVFTKEKQAAMLQSLHDQGIEEAALDLKCVAWWIGLHVEKSDTWDRITSGELRAFSIGGKGKRAAL